MYNRPDNSSTDLLGGIIGAILGVLFVEIICLLLKGAKFVIVWLLRKFRLVKGRI